MVKIDVIQYQIKGFAHVRNRPIGKLVAVAVVIAVADVLLLMSCYQFMWFDDSIGIIYHMWDTYHILL